MAHLLEKDRLINLRMRALSALVLGPLVLGVVYLGGWSYRAMIVLAALLAVREWVRMIAPGPLGRSFAISCTAVLVVVALSLLIGPATALSAAMALTLVAGLAQGAGSGRLRGSDRWWAAFGIPYVAVSCVALIWLRHDPRAGTLLIYILLLSVWANDTGAFVVGRIIGGPRLAPTISPAKTWAGFWGGIASAGLTVGAVAVALDARSPVIAALVAVVLAVMSNVGDLFESAVKRRYRVKDSGGIIPGHGGLLDRIDGLLAAAPVLALFHWLIGARLAWW
ncbi:MAG: phosphatidate cytidylyltransferase [Rhodospirillaceae bacterium]